MTTLRPGHADHPTLRHEQSRVPRMVYTATSRRGRASTRVHSPAGEVSTSLPQDVDRRGAATSTIMTTGAHGVDTLCGTVSMVNEISAGASRAMRSDAAAVIA